MSKTATLCKYMVSLALIVVLMSCTDPSDPPRFRIGDDMVVVTGLTNTAYNSDVAGVKSIVITKLGNNSISIKCLAGYSLFPASLGGKSYFLGSAILRSDQITANVSGNMQYLEGIIIGASTIVETSSNHQSPISTDITARSIFIQNSSATINCLNTSFAWHNFN